MRESTLHLVLSLSGGGGPTPKFADLWAPGARVVQVGAPMAHRNRRIEPGRHPACAAHGHRVIINWGDRNFDFLYESHKCHCPECGTLVEPITCAFSNTWWAFRGLKKLPNTPPEYVQGPWRHSGNAYHAFDETQSGVVGWLRLRILVSSWNPENVCAVCFEKSGPTEKGVGSCGHSLHPACRKKWMNALGMESRTQCPLCREIDRNE
ncbi:hypothetical protein BC936DRAFT_144889 [Jimgerdemannia flammicorona]|uniref:RING-type domain-containing protein n=1 Tax=Jimgerdemannia flammicorona TaxID=994334 RepID=A0A433DBF4_9FUNG|nr:hypothetical protein BC936DRAFT_144889 [Jimgerdemannia flammicorona]